MGPGNRRGTQWGGARGQTYCAVAFYHDEALLDLADIHRPGAVVGAEHVQVPHLSLAKVRCTDPDVRGNKKQNE